MRSSIVCLSCGAVSCSDESFLDLSLPIPRTKNGAAARVAPDASVVGAEGAAHAARVLDQLGTELTTPPSTLGLSACLQAFSAPETLHSEDAYACDACAAKAKAAKEEAADQRLQPALKWVQLAKIPRCLTLHLKRFRTTGRRVSKLDAHVTFPAVLDLSAFACAPGKPAKHLSGLKPSAAAPAQLLKLYCVIEHQGDFDGGHYVAFVRLGGEWFRMSDSNVRRVDEQEVFKVQAFMLFYECAA